MHVPFNWFISGGSDTLSSAECHNGLSAMVAHGRWGHLRCRTYIEAGLSAQKEDAPLEQSEDPPLFGEPLS